MQSGLWSTFKKRHVQTHPHTNTIHTHLFFVNATSMAYCNAPYTGKQGRCHNTHHGAWLHTQTHAHTHCIAATACHNTWMYTNCTTTTMKKRPASLHTHTHIHTHAHTHTHTALLPQRVITHLSLQWKKGPLPYTHAHTHTHTHCTATTVCHDLMMHGANYTHTALLPQCVMILWCTELFTHTHTHTLHCYHSVSWSYYARS